MCDKNMLNKLKYTIQNHSQPSNDIRANFWAATKNDAHKLQTTEMRMLRWARGKTKKDHIKNEDIWREANIEPITMFLRQKRMRWYGHV